MAMTGMRNVTLGLGLVKRTPPERMASEAEGLIGRVPAGKRQAAIELAHWATGAGGGAAFGAAPWAVCRRREAGPIYGLLVWAFFELVIAPSLGVSTRGRPASERLALAGDHLLYGALVGAAMRPRGG